MWDANLMRNRIEYSFQELCNLWVSLCVLRRQLICDRSWTRVCLWNTCVRLNLCSPKPCWIILKVSVAHFPRLAQNLMHTRCSILWSIVKIATGHVHDSKQTRVETAHAILPAGYLARWLAKHGSATIYLCFALPQLLYIWRHQYGKFWINPCMWVRSRPGPMHLGLKTGPLCPKSYTKLKESCAFA